MPQDTEDGVIYVSASGSYYSDPEIDADTLNDVLQNTYLREQLEKTVPQIFSGMYSLTVRGPDGEEDEEVSERVRAMVEANGVMLWARMKQAWEDIHCWGVFLCRPTWERDGPGWTLAELKRFPPESFGEAPLKVRRTYSDILEGITIGDSGEVEYHQVQEEGTKPKKLRNGVVMLKDPSAPKLAGRSKVLPLVPIIKMLDICWDAQMQKVYRVGAPIMFIKVTSPKGNDKEYAETILKNWGRDTAFQLRENMEFVELDIKDSESAMATIEKLEQRVQAHFNPSSNLAKDAPALGGNGAAQKDTNDDWIMGERTMIEDQFEWMLQPYLDLNAYDGYSIDIRVAAKKQNPGYVEARQAEVGFATGCMTINERRDKLGLPLLDDAGIAAMLEERAKLTAALGSGPSAPVPGFGDQSVEEVKDKAVVLQTITGIDPMDPERYMSREEQMAFLGKK